MDTIVRGLAALAPRGMWFDNGIVSLNTSVEAVREEIRATINPLPVALTNRYKGLLSIAP